MIASAIVARRLYHPAFDTQLRDHRRPPARRADRALVRGGEPLPRSVQLPADPAARRRRAARTRDAEPLASGLGAVPPVRDPRALRARVLGRTCPIVSSIRSSSVCTTSSCDESDAPRRRGSSSRCAPRRSTTPTVAWVADALEPAEMQVWDGMNRADRAEGVAVARRLEAALAGTPTRPTPAGSRPRSCTTRGSSCRATARSVERP